MERREAAGVTHRQQAEGVAAMIGTGQGDLTTRDDVAGMRTDVRALQWGVAVLGTSSAATLGRVVAVLAIVLAAA